MSKTNKEYLRYLKLPILFQLSLRSGLVYGEDDMDGLSLYIGQISRLDDAETMSIEDACAMTLAAVREEYANLFGF